MIRRKAMFKIVLIITALCLGKLSEAGNPCIWCDSKITQRFINCLTQRMANNPNFQTTSSLLEDMKTDLLDTSKALKNNGPTKGTMLKGGLAFLVTQLVDTAKNPEVQLSYINSTLYQCYPFVIKNPAYIAFYRAYIDELVKIIKDILKEKKNTSNVQQPEDKTQSEEITQADQNINDFPNNDYSPQQAETDPNQDENKLNDPYDNTQEQELNFQPNPSQGSANNFALNPLGIPYETFPQSPGWTNDRYLGNTNQNQPISTLYANNQGKPYAYQNQPISTLYDNNQGKPYAYQNNANQKYLSSNANNNPRANYESLFDQDYESQSNKRHISSYAISSASAASGNYDRYDYNPNNPALNQKRPVTSINKRKQKRKPTDSRQIKFDNDDDRYPSTSQFKNQKKQLNIYDNSDQSPDNKPISYDKLVKNKAYKKDDLSYTDDKYPSTSQFKNQKKQLNIYDNSDQSPDNKPISYDKLVKNKAYKKDDLSYTDDKTDYSGYDDNYQPPNDKPVNIKQKKGDQSSAKNTDTNTDDEYDDNDYDCEENYDGDGEDDSWSSNDGDINIKSRKDLDFSKKKQNPSTQMFQNQKKQPKNSDQSPGYDPISYEKLIKIKTDKEDEQIAYNSYKSQLPKYKQNKNGYQTNVGSTNKDDDYQYENYLYGYTDSYDDYGDYGGDGDSDNSHPQENDENGNKIPNDFPDLSEKKQALINDSNVNDKSSKDTSQQNFDALNLKNASKNNKQEDTYPDIYNISDNDSKTIPKSKKFELQKNTSTPQYLPEFDKDEDQKITTPLPYITDDQQTSTPPGIDQKISTAPIIQNTLEDNDKKTGLSSVAPVLQPNVSDNTQKLDFKKANNSEQLERLKYLTKLSLDCIKDGKFDYNEFSRSIVALMKHVQKTHPDWGKEKCEKGVLLETTFIMTQLLVKSNVKEVKGMLQQPQKITEPMQLPPNSQQNNQSVSQKDQNPNYQTGQINKNSQQVMQDTPFVNYLAPKQTTEYRPQQKKLQNKRDPNSSLLIHNTPIRQPNYPLQPIPTVPQNTAQVNSWKINEQKNPPATNNNPGLNGNEVRWINSQSRAAASSTVTQNAAQGNSWNTDNQWQNYPRPINSNNANSLQFRKRLPIPGPFNTNQGNGKWGDKIFPIPQPMNGNVGIPDNKNFPNPLNYQANWPDFQQKEVNNPTFPQNGVQGNWYSTSNGQNIPTSLRYGNPGFAAEQGNRAPIPNGPSSPRSMQYQIRNQGFGSASQIDNSPQRNQRMWG